MTLYRIVLGALVALLLASPALAERRVALVVGNGAYTAVAPLPNPARDADAIAAKLTELGFEVIVAKDASRDAMTVAMGKFITTLDGADVGLFYYAGHGIQYEGRNYLIGTNATISNQFALSSESLALDEVITAMESVSATNLIFLDACRDNPFVDKLKASLPASRSALTNEGLAPVRAQQGRDTMIVYATAANNVASDGNGEHSPFAEAILTHVGTPGIEVSLVVKRVIQSVRVTTEYKQNPEILSAMAIEFYFAEPTGPSSAGTVAEPALTPAPTIPAPILPAPTETAAAPATPEATEEPAPGFDTSRLAALDVDQALAAAAATTVATLSPAEVEAALGLEREDAQRIQTALNAMGYDLGTPDGEFGAKSREALKEFQVVNRVPQTGYLDEPTIQMILKVFDEAPKTFDGKWQIDIYRHWLIVDTDTPGSKVGDRQLLATLYLTHRDGELLIDNYTIRTVMPDEPFKDFSAHIRNGKLIISSTVSTHFYDANNLVANLRPMSVEVPLPQIMPINRLIEADANTFERAMAFLVAVRRPRS